MPPSPLFPYTTLFRSHPRWRTPYVALILQAVCAAVFVFLGQAGTSVKGAYDVLVSMGIITYFLPYLFLFGAMFRLQREPAGPDRKSTRLNSSHSSISYAAFSTLSLHDALPISSPLANALCRSYPAGCLRRGFCIFGTGGH